MRECGFWLARIIENTEYRKSASLTESEMRLSYNLLTNQYCYQ